MTNYHVVRDATKIAVDLNDKNHKELQATLVGGDPQTDIAILKVEGKDFPYLKFGNSEEVEVAEWVMAIGNPFQLEASVSVGVISAKGRNNLQISDLEDFLQTDAAINPGNSGGPLLDLDGHVIGMNTAIVSRSGGYMGIGFAIPSTILKTVQNQLIQNGEVTRGFLGVSLQDIDRDMAEALHMKHAEGALVAEVIKDSPAAKAGIEQGDIILEINGSHVKNSSTLRNEVLLSPPGETIKLKVNRSGKIMDIDVKIGEYEQKRAVMSDLAKKLGLEVQTLSPEIASQYGYKEDEGVVIRS